MQTEANESLGITSKGRVIGPGQTSFNGTENYPGAGYVRPYQRIVPITATGADQYAYYTIGNLSNKRNTSVVYTYGNDISKWSYGKYEVVTGAVDNQPNNLTHETITDTMNTKQEKYHLWWHDRAETPASYTSTNLRIGAGGTMDTSSHSQYDGRYHLFNCIWYYIKIWHNYYLEHYFIPLPKGTWLSDGRQMPYDGFFDIITNTIGEPDMRLTPGYDPEGKVPTNPNAQTYWSVQQQKSVYPTIYKLGDAITGSTVDFFERWNYDYDDVNYVVKTTETIPGYKHPDLMSETIVDSYYNGTIMPITKVTSDSANKVQGTWYFNGLAWVQADKCEILPITDYPMTALTKIVAIKGDSDTSTTFTGYFDPFNEESWHKMAYNSETTTNVYFTCRDKFYWDGRRWVAIDTTSDYTEEINKTYIVAVDYLPVYKYPISNNVHQTTRLQSGDRVQAVARLVRNYNWVKIMIGSDERWINIDNTTTELE